MANGKDVDWVKWAMCLLALTAVVLAALIYSKVDKRCKKQGYLPPNRMAMRSRARNLKMNNPTEIAKLANYRCGTADKSLIDNFSAVMNMENMCQGTLWDENVPPGFTDDDNVMMALCNALGSEYESQYQSQINAIQCALNPPNGNVSQCC